MQLRMGIVRKRRRGIALITSLFACLFMVMLTGALIQNQSGAFSIAQTSDASVRARAACQTAYDYCLYQLEHDRNWGSGAGFDNPASVDPARASNIQDSNLSDYVQIQECDGRTLRGYLPEHSCSFEVTVSNALTMAAQGTPSEQVTLEITAWDGQGQRQTSRSVQGVHCRLRLAPLYDASIQSRGTVSVDAQEAVFASKDEFRNEVRAEGGISLPGLTQGSTKFVKHDEQVINTSSDIDSMTADRTGMLWSGSNISEFSGSHAAQALDQDGLREASRRSNGRMVDNASNRADIYDLKPENIPQPTNLREVTVPPGEFRFTKAMATVTYDEDVEVADGLGGITVTKVRKQSRESVDVLEYYDPPGSLQPLKVLRRATRPLDSKKTEIGVRVDYGMAGVVAEVGDRFELDNANRNSVIVTDENGIPQSQNEMGFRKIGSGATAPVTIDLSTQTVSVASGTKVQPASRPQGSTLQPSAFELTTKPGSGGVPQLPTFQLGNGNNDVVFEADGNISIGVGYTKGLGTIISKTGNVNLNPLPQDFRWVRREVNGVMTWVPEVSIDVSANSQYAGLVVYADKDVHIGNISDADWNLRGFVYARRNFIFDVNNENATFFGSVVAGNGQNGEFQITRGKRATFIYDPEYLKLMTRQLGNGWTRLEPLVWSESRG